MGRYLNILRQAGVFDAPKRDRLLADHSDFRDLTKDRAFQCGVLIAWKRIDGTTARGLINLIHTDPDGTCWAFVTLADVWVAVNLKFAKIIDEI